RCASLGRESIAQVRRLNRDFGNPKRAGSRKKDSLLASGKRGLESAVSSNRVDNLQAALEPRCTDTVVYIERGAGLVEDLPSGYPRGPAGLACRILHVPLAGGSSWPVGRLQDDARIALRMAQRVAADGRDNRI
ncbi:Uncharacterized protein DBV15_08497, partial [Temnothorax longispinosus]